VDAVFPKFLLVVEPTHFKKYAPQIGLFPQNRGENKKLFETIT